MAITIDADERAGADVVTITGEVDIRTAPELRDRLSTLLETGTDRLVLDLERVDFLDSTALSVMVGAHKRLARQGSSLGLVCTNESVLRVLNVTGLSRIFDVHDTLDGALGLTVDAGGDEGAPPA
jgi:anti-sigma B factor antagonist